MENFLKLIFLIALIVQGTYVVAQENDESKNDSTFYAFEKGNFYLSVGANFSSDVSKNSDEFIYYVIDEKEDNFNIKLGFGYMIKDGKSVGIGYRYKSKSINTLYETSIGDTINYQEKTREHIANISYGMIKPLFGSKRVFMISDPSIFVGSLVYDGIRTTDDIFTTSRTESISVSAGLNVGVLVLPFEKMSFQATVGPVGAGYKIDNFHLNGESDGSTSSFFLRMTPDLWSFEFSISRYF